MRRFGLLAFAGAFLLTSNGVARAQDARPLDLEALVREAVGRHPELRGVRRSAAAARQVPSRAGSLPDPMVSIQARSFRVDRPRLGADPMTGIELGLSQDVPFPGKLARRSEVAQAEAQVADQEVRTVQSEVALRVRRAYWQLHLAEQTERITSDNEKVLSSIADIVTNRFTVGLLAQQDVYQAQVAHSRVRADLEERKQAVVSGRRALNRASGRAPNEDLAPTGPPPEPSSLDRQQLLRAVRERNPAVLLDRARALGGERTVAEAQRDRWPDLQLGASYMFRGVVQGDPMSGADMFSVSLGVSLPVWLGRKQNARVREARERLGAAEAAVEATLLDITTEVQTALDAIERISRQIALYVNDVLPKAGRALAASTADYQVGKTSLVSLLQNWQMLLDAQLDLERLRAERAVRLAELRALFGEDGPW